MIDRHSLSYVTQQLAQFPAVALLGPRQVGKTTLALQLAKNLSKPHIYLDLERPSDLAKLSNPELYLQRHSDKLIIIDEIQRRPDLFPILRSLIDENKRQGYTTNQFLLLGSASGDLLQKSSETLAGRIDYIDMYGLNLLEVGGPPASKTNDSQEKLWLRGGFPDSYLSTSDKASFNWRQSLIRTYLEREIQTFGVKVPSESLRRFLGMLAHDQGEQFNASRLGSGLGVSVPTIGRYLDIFQDLFLIRVLRPWHGNYGKRLVKTPKVYLRDSGLLHALLGIRTQEDLLSHPVVGCSWEGFVIESIASIIGHQASLWYYRTSSKEEIDLIIEYAPTQLITIEIKRSINPVPSKGYHDTLSILNPLSSYIVYPGTERYPLSSNTDVIGLREIMEILASYTSLE